MGSGSLRAAAVGLIVAGLTACAAPPEPAPLPDQPAQSTPAGGRAEAGIAVFDPATVIQDDWMHLALNPLPSISATARAVRTSVM